MTVTPREEAIRKAFHLALSLVAAAVVWWLPPVPAATVLAAATFAALSLELARRMSGSFGRTFLRYVGRLLRDREAGRVTGATTLALGYTLAAVLFPGTPAFMGILVAGVADAVAATVGKRFGRVRYPGGKSLEGSAAFLVVVLAIGLLVPAFRPGGALLFALGLTVLEALTLPIDDNLYLPPVAAAAVYLAAPLTGVTFLS